jgi:hypothetical protein
MPEAVVKMSKPPAREQEHNAASIHEYEASRTTARLRDPDATSWYVTLTILVLLALVIYACSTYG